ncbi:hypothetical protein DdX_18139 [Ditylenchus destructor]|uniref:Uncharacterized protein n=1 Tax=Ditylenchus destructor TaxID=166010 RepID=A0AAD4MQM2_9BILA|nr:hypothetical protein DdX_18139 [Ditylenchus destructor]
MLAGSGWKTVGRCPTPILTGDRKNDISKRNLWVALSVELVRRRYPSPADSKPAGPGPQEYRVSLFWGGGRRSDSQWLVQRKQEESVRVQSGERDTPPPMLQRAIGVTNGPPSCRPYNHL